MERVMLHTRLHEGKEEEYEQVHRVIPPDLDRLLRESGVRAWRIYRLGLDLFHYVEVENYREFLSATSEHPVNRAWQERMAPLLEIAHDYGRAGSNMLPLVWELPCASRP